MNVIATKMKEFYELDKTLNYFQCLWLACKVVNGEPVSKEEAKQNGVSEKIVDDVNKLTW